MRRDTQHSLQSQTAKLKHAFPKTQKMSKRPATTGSKKTHVQGFSTHELGRTLTRVIKALEASGIELYSVFEGDTPEAQALRESCASSNVAETLNNIQDSYRAIIVPPRQIAQANAPPQLNINNLEMLQASFGNVVEKINQVGRISENQANEQASARAEQLQRDQIMESRIAQQSAELARLTGLLTSKKQRENPVKPKPAQKPGSGTGPGPSGGATTSANAMKEWAERKTRPRKPEFFKKRLFLEPPVILAAF